MADDKDLWEAIRRWGSPNSRGYKDDTDYAGLVDYQVSKLLVAERQQTAERIAAWLLDHDAHVEAYVSGRVVKRIPITGALTTIATAIERGDWKTDAPPPSLFRGVGFKIKDAYKGHIRVGIVTTDLDTHWVVDWGPNRTRIRKDRVGKYPKKQGPWWAEEE